MSEETTRAVVQQPTQPAPAQVTVYPGLLEAQSAQTQSDDSSGRSTRSTAILQSADPDPFYDPRFLAQAMALARTLASSAIIPKHFQNKPADVLVTLLKGRELGLGPIQSLSEIYVLNGKAGLSAALIVGLCARRPNICLYFSLVSSDDTVATYETLRAGAPRPVTMSYTIAQAERAGLLRNPTWTQHRAAMLRARCASALAKVVYPDLAAGIYSQDEVQEMAKELRVAAPRAAEEKPGDGLSRGAPTPSAPGINVPTVGSASVSGESGQPEEPPPLGDNDSPPGPDESSGVPPPAGQPAPAPEGDSYEKLSKELDATPNGVEGRLARLNISRRVVIARVSGKLSVNEIENLRDEFRKKEAAK